MGRRCVLHPAEMSQKCHDGVPGALEATIDRTVGSRGGVLPSFAIGGAMFRKWIFVPLVPAAVVGGMLLIPNSFWYRERRPTRAGKAIGNAWAFIAAKGLTPDFIVRLEVPGRTSGVPRSIPLVAADVDGERYLVSMLGPDADWVRNVEAAGREATIEHRGRRTVRLELVPPGERAPILKAYVQRANGARPHIPVAPSAPVAAFEPIAADYPVYRIARD